MEFPVNELLIAASVVGGFVGGVAGNEKADGQALINAENAIKADPEDVTKKQQKDLENLQVFSRSLEVALDEKGAEEAKAKEADQAKKPNKVRTFVSKTTGRAIGGSALGLLTGIAAGLTAYGIIGVVEAQPHSSGTPPTLEVVADKTADQITLTGKSNAPDINKVANAIANDKKLKTAGVIVGGNISTLTSELDQTGDVAVQPTSKISSIAPFYSGSMADGVNKALSIGYSDSTGIQSNSLNSKSNSAHASGVLVLTNNAAIGTPGLVIDQAEKDGKEPVFVVNSNPVDPTTTSGLQEIAKKTGGHYWAATGSNSANIANTVEASIKPDSQLVVYDRDFSKIFVIVSGLGLMATSYLFYRNKSDYAKRRNLRGE